MPVVMLSTLTFEGAPITLEALEIGAVDFLEKPKVNVAEELPRYSIDLQEKIRAAASARVTNVKDVSSGEQQRASALTQNWEHLNFKLNHIIAIGASTGGTEAIKEIIKKTGQVCIQIRDVQGVDDNPFDFDTVKKNIEEKLNPEFEGRFKIMLVPNVTNICYGRGVGYKIEEIVLPEEIPKISATKIRAKMREEGKLK